MPPRLGHAFLRPTVSFLHASNRILLTSTCLELLGVQEAYVAVCLLNMCFFARILDLVVFLRAVFTWMRRGRALLLSKLQRRSICGFLPARRAGKQRLKAIRRHRCSSQNLIAHEYITLGRHAFNVLCDILIASLILFWAPLVAVGWLLFLCCSYGVRWIYSLSWHAFHCSFQIVTETKLSFSQYFVGFALQRHCGRQSTFTGQFCKNTWLESPFSEPLRWLVLVQMLRLLFCGFRSAGCECMPFAEEASEIVSLVSSLVAFFSIVLQVHSKCWCRTLTCLLGAGISLPKLQGNDRGIRLVFVLVVLACWRFPTLGRRVKQRKVSADGAQSSNDSILPLVNAGNSCFVNASLQLLFASPLIRTKLRSVLQQLSENTLHALEREARESSYSCAEGNNEQRLALTLQGMSNSRTCQPVRPNLLLKRYYNGRQADAHEFLMSLLQTCEAPFLACSTFVNADPVFLPDHANSQDLVQKTKLGVSLASDGVVPGLLGLHGTQRMCDTCGDDVLLPEATMDASICLSILVETSCQKPRGGWRLAAGG